MIEGMDDSWRIIKVEIMQKKVRISEYVER